jgi:hypothetical protein
MLNRLAYIAIAGLLVCLGTVTSRAAFYQLDDGASEDSLGASGNPGSSFDLIGLNQFNIINGQDMIGTVEIAWGTPAFPSSGLNGLTYTAAVWADPNLDGDPSDAVLLATAPGTISNANTNTFNISTFSTCIHIPTTSFFVGFLLTHQDGQFPAAIDETNPNPSRSFVTVAGAGQGDIAVLTNNSYLPLDSLGNYGLNANFLVRADLWAVPEPTTTSLLAIAATAGLLAYRARLKKQGTTQRR